MTQQPSVMGQSGDDARAMCQSSFPPDRMGHFTVIKNANGIAFAVMAAACIGQQITNETSQFDMWTIGLSEQSFLVLVYAIVVRILFSRGLEVWSTNFQQSPGYSKASVPSSKSNLQARSSPSDSSIRLFSLSRGGDGNVRQTRRMAISETEPFLPVDEISRLTISDIKEIFQYAIKSSRPSFESSAFATNLNSLCRKATDGIDNATLTSRGGGPPPQNQSENNSIDALYFAAVVRIFAEWRVLRLVPTGSSARYTFGMNMAHRDLVQNISKIERAAHDWMSHHEKMNSEKQQQGPNTTVESPTLRQLLLHEIAENKHRYLPRLQDKSGASGLLWIKRQLEYQTRIFGNLSNVPLSFPDSKSAVIAAYKSTYDNYHGFVVRRVFLSSFNTAPDAQAILDFMNHSSSHDNEVDQEDTDDESESSSIQMIPIDLAEIDVSDTQKKQPNPIDNLVQEFSKLADFLNQCAGLDIKPNETRNALVVNIRSTDVIEKPLTKKSTGSDLSCFVHSMQGILSDLNKLIDEFNMNDPSKV